MLGHELAVSETNAGALVPTCSCGWSGQVWWIEGGARADHARHAQGVRAQGAPTGPAWTAYRERVMKIVRRPNRHDRLF